MICILQNHNQRLGLFHKVACLNVCDTKLTFPTDVGWDKTKVTCSVWNSDSLFVSLFQDCEFNLRTNFVHLFGHLWNATCQHCSKCLWHKRNFPSRCWVWHDKLHLTNVPCLRFWHNVQFVLCIFWNGKFNLSPILFLCSFNCGCCTSLFSQSSGLLLE